MKKGLWIDHHKAVIVTVTGENGATKVIHSDLEKHGKSGNDADDTSLNVFTKHLNKYYEKVISELRSADSIFLFGPGEAKGELEKRLAKENLGEHVKSIETADKMTDAQVAAKVKEHFLHHGAARIMSN
ncbi:MAG: hypothetical protein ABI686_14150 [Acidobacteriota bacterium]